MTDSNKTSAIDDLRKVIEGGYCIGCGACAAYDRKINIVSTEYGLYQAELNNSAENDAGEICPFSSHSDEDKLGRDLYAKDSSFDKRIGFYKSIYAGFVTEKDYRSRGSSGGLVTWVLENLMGEGKIDGVIHVGETGRYGELFEYKISTSAEEIKNNSKSRYYPVHFDEVIHKVRESNGSFAFVGVPCFIKAMRLLILKDEEIARKVQYCISVFCGHFKSKAFAEMIGWQQNVKPENLVGIDFRVKRNNQPANQYGLRVTSSSNGDLSKKINSVSIRALYGMDWGLGFFKPKACDWCDDIAGETADLACGDAWLPEFERDSGGTSIMVVRNSDIQELLQKGANTGNLHLETQSVERVYQSQAGNYRHRQEGLSVRIKAVKKKSAWFPWKRISENTFIVPEERQEIYLLRSKISEVSHQIFLQAKTRNSFLYFIIKMLPLEIKYYRRNGNFLKGLTKSGYQVLRFIFRSNI